MSKIKIGLITYSVSFGGVGTFIISLGEKLKEKGYEVVVITTDKKGTWFDILKEKGILSFHYNFGLWGWIPLGRLFHSLRVGKFIKKHHFDIVLVNHSFFALASAGYYQSQTKIISVIHNQLMPVVKSGCLNQGAIDSIVCVGSKVYQNAIKIVPEEKVFTIFNGVKLPLMSKVLGNPINNNGTLNLLFVGRLDNNQKGVFLLPGIIRELLNSNTQIELTLVGDGPDRNQLMKMFDVAGVSSVVNYLGLLSNEEVYKLYANHHILILPSYFEGLPLTLIEAMGSGCIPVVSMLPGSTDICVNDGISGFLVKVGDVGQFASRIKALAMNTQLLNEMRINSIKIANEKFSIDKMISHYESLFSKVLLDQRKSVLPNINLGKDWWKEFVPYFLIMNYKKYKNIWLGKL